MGITMKTLLRWLLSLVALLALLLVGPAWLLVTNQVATDVHWSSLDRTSTGIAPNPAAYSEAVVQVYSARAYNWRGAFGEHIWIATKAENADSYRLHQVLSWRQPTVVSSIDTPDRTWFGNPPTLLADYRGEAADQMIPKIEAAATDYPQADLYRVWPGPNSNSFIAWVIREVPGFEVTLPVTAIGKDYIFNGVFAPTPSGTGYQFSLGGVIGIMFALEEGFEINFLGLSFGFDVMRPALKLPGIGRLGMPARVSGRDD